MKDLIKLEALFGSSPDQFLSDAQLQPDPALVAEGWERRFTADEQRAQEAMDLYTQLGYEVRAEPLRSQEFHDHCQDCGTTVSASFRTIYTRKKPVEQSHG